MITLFFDGILPFIIISIMNTLIIRAIKQRHRELEGFTDDGTSRSSASSDPKTGKIIRNVLLRTLAT